jgi:hypothetical protein
VLKACTERLRKDVQQARERWQHAADTQARLKRTRELIREQRSREAKEKEHRWLREFQAQQRARHAAEQEERRLTYFRQEQRKAARREREKQREINEKREKLARHTQRYLEQEELKKRRGENWKSIRYYSEAIERGGEVIPRLGHPVSLQVLTVMRVLCENKEKEYAARLAELEIPLYPRVS